MPYKQKTTKVKERNVTAYGEVVLAQGQADDLILDSGTRRIWRSRINNSISQEKLVNGRWVMA